jgi:hypothetical protein
MFRRYNDGPCGWRFNMTTTAEPAMARRNDVTVKMDADVAAIAKMVASSKNISLAQYLSEVVRPVAQRDLDQEYAKRSKVEEPRKAKGPKKEGA